MNFIMKIYDLTSDNADENCKCPCECGRKSSTYGTKYCIECDPFHTTYQRSELKEHLGKHFRGKRKGFSNSVKQSAILKQKALCAICNKFSQTWDFDHKDNDRSNNNQSNYQALCPNCHANKTRGLN